MFTTTIHKEAGGFSVIVEGIDRCSQILRVPFTGHIPLTSLTVGSSCSDSGGF